MRLNKSMLAECKDHLRQKTIAGVGWSTLGHVCKQGFLFVISVVLARLIAPEDFGLVGMVLVFGGFANLFGDLGFSAALIQKEVVTEGHYSSVFWVNVIAGLILTGSMAVCAPIIAAFYNEPRL